MEKKLCISTFVSGEDYQEFIPVYIFSILKAYPDYGILIFCGESLKSSVKHSCDLLKNIGNFKIIENFFPYTANNLSNRVISKLKRWLIYSDDFENYEYIYIGDIDMFIVKENPSLLTQHLIHCDTISLDYSNVIRRANGRRITGLHFVKRKPYFEKALPVINRYAELIKNDCFKYEFESSEFLLYDIIEEAGLGFCPRATDKMGLHDPGKPTFRPPHGIHLAIFRNLFLKKQDMIAPGFIERMRKLKKVIDDPVFKSIEEKFESKMVKRIFKKIHKFSLDKG